MCAPCGLGGRNENRASPALQPCSLCRSGARPRTISARRSLPSPSSVSVAIRPETSSDVESRARGIRCAFCGPRNSRRSCPSWWRRTGLLQDHALARVTALLVPTHSPPLPREQISSGSQIVRRPERECRTSFEAHEPGGHVAAKTSRSAHEICCRYFCFDGPHSSHGGPLVQGCRWAGQLLSGSNRLRAPGRRHRGAVPESGTCPGRAWPPSLQPIIRPPRVVP